MAGNLNDMGAAWGVAMLNPLPSDGLTSPLAVKTSIFWSEKRLISNSSHLLTFNWECSGLGLALNLIALENTSFAVSTDPILQITTNLVEFQGPLPTFGMPYLFRCTGLILVYKQALMTAPIRIQFFNQNDSNDSIMLIED
jgi:ABC-type tungstate transport system substrate-binding protein